MHCAACMVCKQFQRYLYGFFPQSNSLVTYIGFSTNVTADYNVFAKLLICACPAIIQKLTRQSGFLFLFYQKFTFYDI